VSGTGPLAVLVGPPGAGKSTVGRILAGRLGTTLRDTDRDVERVAGKTVAEVFYDDGEDAFRVLERAAVATALREHDGVLALGGGAVLDAGTRDLLRRSGSPVVLLEVGLSDAAKRVGFARDRPVLALNPRATLRELMAARAPLYDEVATVRIPTGGVSPRQVVGAVIAALRDLPGAASAEEAGG
jgi:shikimate kinase